MKKNFKAMAYDQPGVTRDRHYGIATVESQTGIETEDIILVDTGGFYPEKVETKEILGSKKTAEPFFNIMADHAKLAIDESDLILFVVDVREGLLPFDKMIADYIRTTKKPMWLLVNKFDDDSLWGNEADFYELGLNEDCFHIISAEHGRGLTQLAEDLFETSKNFQTEEMLNVQKGVTPNQDVVANVSIIGAPNAGKSTLLNYLIGAQRALVSNIAGTTVDPIEGYIDLFFGAQTDHLEAIDNAFRKSNSELLNEYIEHEEALEEAQMLKYEEVNPYAGFDDFEDDSEDLISEDDTMQAVSLSEDEAQEEEIFEEEVAPEDINPYRSIKIVDTAGIRKQSQVSGFIEEQSVYRSLKAISECDIVIYMIDATKGMTHQDRRLCDIALDKGKSIIICLNKVDLMPEVMKDSYKKREWIKDLRATIPWLSFCEVITLSAKKGSYVNTLKESLKKTIVIRSKKVQTSRLNKTITSLIDRRPVMLEKSKGEMFKVRYASMLKTAPPTFLLFSNKSKGIPVNFKRYLVKGIRSEFKLVNTPVHLIFRSTADIEKKLHKSIRKGY
jgi:GTP-binding protein